MYSIHQTTIKGEQDFDVWQKTMLADGFEPEDIIKRHANGQGSWWVLTIYGSKTGKMRRRYKLTTYRGALQLVQALQLHLKAVDRLIA